MIKKLLLLFRTLRFLKPVQFYWRLYLKIKPFFYFSDVINEAVNVRQIELIPCVTKYCSYANGQFCFLNQTEDARVPVDWNNIQVSKLWLYNLHYFDYLNQADIEPQYAVDLMQDWVKHNPVGSGNGWEPYTLSLRIVNWVKYLSSIDLSEDQCKTLYISLLLQARFLLQHLEYHLLGNHLFKNAVALVFAGVYFNTKEAQRWLNKGLQIIALQVREQVLADGGHFERSPMYHVLILEDILNCLNLHQTVSCFSDSEAGFVKGKAADMLIFLSDILHQDGEIPFFNDSAFRVAPNPEVIFKYAERLSIELGHSGLQAQNSARLGCIEKTDSGLLILHNPSAKVIFNVGGIGPDYLPGHAHCDSLSYELSIAGLRCIVNSGTYQYAGTERNYFRATEAHNTVKIDGVEQHETWSTFRVARRGKPMHVSVERQENGVIVAAASLSEFESVQAVHQRRISLNNNQLIVEDVIEGRGSQRLAESFVHLHPDVKITQYTHNEIHCQRGDVLFSIHALEHINIEKGYYSTEFGVKVENKVLVLRKQAISPFTFGYKICF